MGHQLTAHRPYLAIGFLWGLSANFEKPKIFTVFSLWLLKLEKNSDMN
jgi:hypothetical protein